MTGTAVVVVEVYIHGHSLEAGRDSEQGDIAVHQFGLLDELAETIAVVLATEDTRGAVANQNLSPRITLEFEAGDFLARSSSPAAHDSHSLKLVLAVMLNQTTRGVGFIDQVATATVNRFSKSAVGQSLLQTWRRGWSVIHNGGVRVLEVFGILYIMWMNKRSSLCCGWE